MWLEIVLFKSWVEFRAILEFQNFLEETVSYVWHYNAHYLVHQGKKKKYSVCIYEAYYLVHQGLKKIVK